MIIGLTGRNGAGKGTVADWFRQRGFEYASLSDVIRADLRERGLDITRDHLITGGRRLRHDGGPGVLAERILGRIEANVDFVVDSIRNPAEVDVLRTRPEFVLLEVAADELTRYQRMVSRARSGDATSFEQFQRQEHAELQSADSAAQQLVATAAMADHVVPNDGSVADLQAWLSQRFGDR